MPTNPPDWDAMRRSAGAGIAAPDWPAHVRQISLEGLGLLGIDGEQRLYWDGKRIEVRQRLTLSWWQKLGAVLVVVATVTGGLGSCAQGVVEVVKFGCQRGWWHHGCANEPVRRPPTSHAG